MNPGKSNRVVRRRTAQRGFTLIELMVVVAIIAIIAGIAVSSFSGSGRDANRARGEADISALNDAMSRYYQTSYTYYQGPTSTIPVTIPMLTAAAGLTLTDQYVFNIVVTNAGQSYIVTAVPSTAGTQSGDGALSINNTGQRCYYPGIDSPSFSTCPKPF